MALQVAAVACLSCRDDAIVRPAPHLPMSQPAVHQAVAGCARISVHVDLSTSAVSLQNSSNVTGHVVVWRLDTLLAASGEVQQIAPGERSRRVWLEFTKPGLWLRPGEADAVTTLSVRLDASGIQNIPDVPAMPPDSIHAFVNDTAIMITDSRASLPFAPDVVVISFKAGTAQQQRAAAIARVNGIVVGGRRYGTGDGFYVVQLPADSTNDRVFNALAILATDDAVAGATVYWFLVGGTTDLRPHDATPG